MHSGLSYTCISYMVFSSVRQQTIFNLFKFGVFPFLKKFVYAHRYFFPSFSLSDVVCFGVGAGANVLTELAVSYFLALQIQ